MTLLTVTVRLASAAARDTTYEDVIVDASDGGDAQRQAIALVQKKHPALSVTGGPVRPATPEEAAAFKRPGRPKKEEAVVTRTETTTDMQRGVRPHRLDEVNNA